MVLIFLFVGQYNLSTKFKFDQEHHDHMIVHALKWKSDHFIQQLSNFVSGEPKRY